MTGEISIYGLYVPPLLLLVVPALAASRAAGALLARTGFYRHVWHPALFDFSLFVIILGSLASFVLDWF